jgi:hypothetical protein
VNESLGEDAWADILDSWRKSGLGQAEFCRANKIKPSAFYYWRKRLDKLRHKPKKTHDKGSSSKKIKNEEAEFFEIPIPEIETPKNKQSKLRMVRFTTSYGAVMEFPL